jgi:hypothetical protein
VGEVDDGLYREFSNHFQETPMRNRRRPVVRVIPQPGQKPDDLLQGLARWRKELAFNVAKHPELAKRARDIGIVLDLDEPEPGSH